MDASDQLRFILSHYDLGDLVAFEQNARGYVNTSFATDCVKDGLDCRYFLRCYKPGIQEGELLFEHSLIRHLTAKGAPPVARVYPTRQGDTYVKVIQPAGEPRFYAVFDYLGGEDRYTWVNPQCTDVEIRGSAQVLAQFHHAVLDLAPQGRRVEPGILELLPQVAAHASHILRIDKETVFDSTLRENFALIREETAQVLAALDRPPARRLLRLVIHCDFHPGNLKFLGDEVVGVFDFDWSKVDYRLFDFALAAYYFFTAWEDPLDGSLRLAPFRLFLDAYQGECRRLPGLSPLDRDELFHLPAMLRAANLYVLNWTLLDYLHKAVDPLEYLKFLHHGLAPIRWFADPENMRQLENALSPP